MRGMVVAVVALALVAGCREADGKAPAAAGDGAGATKSKGGATMKLHSTAFEEGGPIPAEYTCDGADVSPPLSWSGAPEGTRAFALICDDPDAPAGTWLHWTIWNIPGDRTSLPKGVSKAEHVLDGARQGRNDFRKIGYGGPCPPPGPAHRYYFRLYALNAPLDLPAGATRAQLESAMKGHVLATATLMGRYQRAARR